MYLWDLDLGCYLPETLQKPSPESLELEQGSAATRCGLLGLPYGILLGIAEGCSPARDTFWRMGLKGATLGAHPPP